MKEYLWLCTILHLIQIQMKNSSTIVFVIAILLLVVDYGSCSKINILDPDNSPEVNSYRKMIVENNLKIIREHNSNPLRTFDMKVNPQFISLTLAQFKQKYLKNAFQITSNQLIPINNEKEIKQPSPKFRAKQGTSVDLSVADPTVYNQGACGNCYAFASVDGINMFNSLWQQWIPPLSIEQLTDCSNNPNLRYHNFGCNGGNLQITMWYIARYGLVSQSNYPLNNLTYLTGQSQPCISTNAPTFKIEGWYSPQTPNCSFQMALLGYGYPVTATVFANNNIFMNYGSGIISGCPATTRSMLDHAVLMVGYTKNGTNGSYLKIKNSWGTSWGEEGYFKISMFNNECGICFNSVSSY